MQNTSNYYKINIVSNTTHTKSTKQNDFYTRHDEVINFIQEFETVSEFKNYLVKSYSKFYNSIDIEYEIIVSLSDNEDIKEDAPILDFINNDNTLELSVEVKPKQKHQQVSNNLKQITIYNEIKSIGKNSSKKFSFSETEPKYIDTSMTFRQLKKDCANNVFSILQGNPDYKKIDIEKITIIFSDYSNISDDEIVANHVVENSGVICVEAIISPKIVEKALNDKKSVDSPCKSKIKLERDELCGKPKTNQKAHRYHKNGEEKADLQGALNQAYIKASQEHDELEEKLEKVIDDHRVTKERLNHKLKKARDTNQKIESFTYFACFAVLLCTTAIIGIVLYKHFANKSSAAKPIINGIENITLPLVNQAVSNSMSR